MSTVHEVDTDEGTIWTSVPRALWDAGTPDVVGNDWDMG